MACAADSAVKIGWDGAPRRVAQDGLVIARPIGELPIDNVMAFIRDNRVLRDFSCEEREQYRILPLCDANGDVPEVVN